MDEVELGSLDDSLWAGNAIDEACDQFESAWAEGRRLTIESVLDRHPESIRGPLFTQLLALELELRQAHGESLSADEYSSRFPDSRDIIQQLFSDLRGSQLEATASFGDASSETVNRPLQQGVRLRQFRLVSRLGAGAFGTVWRAYDTKLRRYVAIKLPNVRQLSPRQRTKVLEEARAVASLRHAHVVTVHEIGEQGPLLFIVSEYVEGGSLRDRLQQSPLQWPDALRLIESAARGLSHAHEHGLIHRDLKPANILLDGHGQPLIADFGLATRTVAPDQIPDERSAGRLIGTPAYMAPEQARGDIGGIDQTTDVYALGAILHECLVGAPPFKGSLESVLTDIIHQQATAPSKQVSGIPASVDQICLKCLSKAKAERYLTAEDLASACRTALASADPPDRTKPARDRIDRRQAFVGLGGLMATSLAFALWKVTSRPEGRVISIETQPKGCQITLVRIDDVSGEPDVSTLRTLADTTPLTASVEPGEYLIVAVLDDEHFHEVRRRVPAPDDLSPSLSLEGGWRRQSDGTIELRGISIPISFSTEGMQLIDAAEIVSPAGTWYVPAFMADQREAGPALRGQLNWSSNVVEQSSNDAAILTRYEMANTIAERLGKRLPSLAELESLHQAWRTSGLPIQGMEGGVTEWTTTKPTSPQAPDFLRYAAGRSPTDRRVVGNGPNGPGASDDPLRLHLFAENSLRAGRVELGLRPVRSLRPRISPEDYGRPASSLKPSY